MWKHFLLIQLATPFDTFLVYSCLFNAQVLLFFLRRAIVIYIDYKLGYLKDSNAAAHSVDTGIS